MTLIPKDNKVYKKREYWDERFTSEDSYDWLATYKNVEHIIKQFVQSTDRILIVGCGNSTFSADMYDAGYVNITNLDYSEVVIENMREKHKDKDQMSWVVGDMTKLQDTVAFQSFDIVIDKAAMDALMCDEGDVWSPAPHVLHAATAMCTGVCEALTLRGKFLQISFSQPHFRKQYLEQSYWTIETHRIDIGLGYFCYIMLK